jgi:hypothetical protein
LTLKILTLTLTLNLILTFLLITLTFPTPAFASAKGPSFSGVSESSVSANAGAGESPSFSYGVEEYANIRMQAKIGDNATFFSAVNFIAAAGDYALKASAMGVDFSYGDNYIAVLELERLYFKLKGETVDFDGGLMRLPFGYSQVWGSSDFLNPKNPLKPDARPRAVLGGGVAYYPIEDFKLLGFATTGRDPFAQTSGIAGISADKHWDKASVQLLYAFERSNQFPGSDSSMWTHRAGMSVKADIKAGFVMDMLYVYNREIGNKEDGLSLCAGLDYSFFDANLIILAEYLYNGAASSTSIAGGGSFANKNYLYTGATWRFSDFTNAGLALITGIDDVSFVPLVTFNHEIFQGVTWATMIQIPVDRDLLSGNGKRGEFGPMPLAGVDVGSYFYLETKIKLRF